MQLRLGGSTLVVDDSESSAASTRTVAPDGRSEEDNFAFPSLLISFYRDTLRATATVALQVRKRSSFVVAGRVQSRPRRFH